MSENFSTFCIQSSFKVVDAVTIQIWDIDMILMDFPHVVGAASGQRRKAQFRPTNPNIFKQTKKNKK